jgi:hypothetical protein
MLMTMLHVRGGVQGTVLWNECWGVVKVASSRPSLVAGTLGAIWSTSDSRPWRRRSLARLDLSDHHACRLTWRHDGGQWSCSHAHGSGVSSKVTHN